MAVQTSALFIYTQGFMSTWKLEMKAESTLFVSLMPQTPILISEGKGVWQHRVQRVVAAEFNNYLRHCV